MKPARLAVLAIALGAAGAAAFLMSGTATPPAPTLVESTRPSPSVEVLVAGVDLPVGQTIKTGELRWQPWPQDLVPAGATLRSNGSGALDAMTGSIVRGSFLAGEPMRREKLVKTDGTGFMSAILPSGMRAVAISIDTRGASSAGGFILPNDHVDVLSITRTDEAAKGGDGQTAQTILSNIRVLAIGQTVQEKNGEKVVTGDTATLAVSPAQAETLALSAKGGQLSLALRSLTDVAGGPAQLAEAPEGSLTIVRSGVAQTTKLR